MFISGEGAGGMSDGSILFGVAETDISVMHLPDESPYPVMKKGTPFLYNLKTDIHEDHDITLQHPDIVEKMKAIIFEQHTPNPHFSVTLPKR